MKYQKRMTECSVDECHNPVRAKGLCGKHYERMRAHGDVTIDNRATGQKPCIVIDCSNPALARGLCNRHYQLWMRNGIPKTQTVRPYGSGHLRDDGYKIISVEGIPRLEHVYLAEKALGKPLPPKAVVHHVNEMKDDNYTPFNLIICPDQAYHFLLHKRMEEFRYSRQKEEITLKDVK